MKRLIVYLFTFFLAFNIMAQESDSVMIRKIFDQALIHGRCYNNLEQLCTQIGGRLTGSPEAAKAVEWSKKVMERMGLDTVYLQETMVPHWVRGEKEQAKILFTKNNGSQEVAVCALGGSVGTGAEGISAEMIEIRSYEELAKMDQKKIAGKIVFINYPMNPSYIHTFDAYGEAVEQRWAGPNEASKYGAIACVVRSVTLAQDKNPHTGVTQPFDEGVTPIPACAISTIDANALSILLKKEKDVKFFLKMSCQQLPEVLSYNVVGELRGKTKPEEIIVVSGHLDSWDTGQGAHDDGAGCVQSMEVLRIFKDMGLKPDRTIRAVMYMNEENGGRGGKKYAELALKNKEKHIAAIESDEGGFTPRGFGIEGTKEKMEAILKWKPLLEAYGLHDIVEGYGGSDIEKLKDQGVTLIGFQPDSQRYFDLHHTSIDTFDKVSKRELEMGSASMAALVYLLSKYGL